MSEYPYDDETIRRRQAIYWRTLAAAFDQEDRAGSLPDLVDAVAADSDLPELVTDPDLPVDTLLERYPELDEELAGLVADPDPDVEDPIRRDLLYSKLLVNVFGGAAGDGSVSAAEYNQWSEDVRQFERAAGYQPGELLVPSGSEGGQAAVEAEAASGEGAGQPGAGGESRPPSGADAGGDGPGGTRAGLGPGGHGPLVTEAELRRGLETIEAGIVDRMELREVLRDRELTEQMTPSMPMVEQVLQDKDNLSEEARENARRLVSKYVDELADELRIAVEETDAGELDRDQPPKRTFRNLDVEETVWQNLPNWDPDEEKLYVDELHFERKRTSTLPSRLVVVVDQSGSMVDSMVNCTILASIFTELPSVDAHLLAYDTQAVDLTEYVDDPLEVLMQTNLGGGTRGMVAMPLVEEKVRAPDRTAVVWISDFYDAEKRELLDSFRDLDAEGVTVIPVGSVTSSGYQSVDSWMKEQFEAMGSPLVSGSVDTLVREIKEFVG